MMTLLLTLIAGWAATNMAIAVILQIRHRWRRRGRYRAATPWWAWLLMPWLTLPLLVFFAVEDLLLAWLRRAERRLRNPSRKP